MKGKVFFIGALVLLRVFSIQAVTTSGIQNGSTTAPTSPSNATTSTTLTNVTTNTQATLQSTSHSINATTTTNTTLTTSTTTIKPTTVPPTFTPELCETAMLRNGSDMIGGEIPIHFLSPKLIYVAQEKTPIDLECKFCASRPLPWTKILWYKDGRRLASGTDRFHISKLRHDIHEGLYECKVVTPSNQTALKMSTLIVNKDPLFSMIPLVWARNITFTRTTKILWQLRGHRILNALKITLKVRQLGETTWRYKREFSEFVSGSALLDDLEPRTIYIANVTAVNSYGQKESRSIAFSSNAWSSTDLDYGVLTLDFCTRKILGLVTGILGLFFTIGLIYCCCVYPACEFRNHQGYTSPPDQSNDKNDTKKCKQHNHDKDNEHDFCTDYINVDVYEDDDIFKL